MLASIKWIVPILAIALVGVADAAKDANKKKKDGKSAGDIHGVVLSVSKGDVKIRAVAASGKGDKKGAAVATNAEPTIIHTDANTKVTVDGKPADLKSLHPGQQVSITSSNGVAASIDATMPQGGGKGNKKKNK